MPVTAMKNDLPRRMCFAVGALALLAGCTVRHASPLTQHPEHLCIQRNPAVIIEDSLPTLQAVLRERGVQSAVYKGATAPASCSAASASTSGREAAARSSVRSAVCSRPGDREHGLALLDQDGQPSPA